MSHSVVHFYCCVSPKTFDLFYWRTRSGVEVDFVLYGEAAFWAVEVKNARDVKREDLRGLKAFGQDYPECEPLLLYRGRDRFKIDDVLCLPVEDFLRGLVPGRGLTAGG